MQRNSAGRTDEEVGFFSLERSTQHTRNCLRSVMFYRPLKSLSFSWKSPWRFGHLSVHSLCDARSSTSQLRQSWYLPFVVDVQPSSWSMTNRLPMERESTRRVNGLELHRVVRTPSCALGGSPDVHLPEAASRREGTGAPRTTRRRARIFSFSFPSDCPGPDSLLARYRHLVQLWRK